MSLLILNKKSCHISIRLQNNLMITLISDLVEIRLKFSMLQRLLKEEKNKTGFTSLPSTTNILINLESIDDALKFVKFSKYIPNHSQLALNFGSYSKIKIFSISNNKIQNKVKKIIHFFMLMIKLFLKLNYRNNLSIKISSFNIWVF